MAGASVFLVDELEYESEGGACFRWKRERLLTICSISWATPLTT